MYRFSPTPLELGEMLRRMFPPPRPPDPLHIIYGIVASKFVRALASVFTPFAFVAVIIYPFLFLYTLFFSTVGTSWCPASSSTLRGLGTSLLASIALLVAIIGSILAQLNVHTGVSRTPVGLTSGFYGGTSNLYAVLQSSVLHLGRLLVRPAAFEGFVCVAFIPVVGLLFLARRAPVAGLRDVVAKLDGETLDKWTAAAEDEARLVVSDVGAAKVVASECLGHVDEVHVDTGDALKDGLEEWHEHLADAGLIPQDRWEDAWEDEEVVPSSRNHPLPHPRRTFPRTGCCTRSSSPTSVQPVAS
ncbi:hypothetical protein B0H21DRAFT_369883 [Amylocystis lapponica]|nr:hypothetical protein B0H21DRAFT_369883 [Amylocystis lapponica]